MAVGMAVGVAVPATFKKLFSTKKILPSIVKWLVSCYSKEI